MIQRIQTLYLLLVTILQSILLFSNQATVITAEGERVFRVSSMWPMAVIIVITVLLAFFSIFIYRRRLVQIRITMFNAILLFLLQAVIIYLLLKAVGMSEQIRYSFTVLFPICSVVFSYLAVRAIARDEAMVRAADRLR